MIGFIFNIIKVAFLLGFLVLIHEGGHFLIAKLFKVRVNEFAIGFGPILFRKTKNNTKYTLRAIPLGGFVNMEGEETKSDEEGSFSEKSILKRIAIILAGGVVNIIFAVIIYWVLTILNPRLPNIQEFLKITFDGLKLLFTGQVNVDQLMGPIGVSEVVVNQTKSIQEYLYIMSVISLSLGVTNLLPFPPLDGGRVVLLIIEAIRKKPLKENIEIGLQMTGFILLVGLSIFVAVNDINRF